MNKLRRIRFNGVFIQSKETSFRYMAWSSSKPTNCALEGTGTVYFDFGSTEIEAIEKVKKELLDNS